MEVCQKEFTFTADPSFVQTEHTVDTAPFAEIASQQHDHRPPNRQIVLSGNESTSEKIINIDWRMN